MTVRVRFAPSPTGYLHVGGARTALFNWLYARSEGGVFLLRIEDTDRARSRPEHTQAILDGLSWLGIEVDEGPVFQADGIERHRAHAGALLESGAAYRCFCTAEALAERRAEAERTGAGHGYDGRCGRLEEAESRGRAEVGEPFALRVRVPAEEIGWVDAIHGPMSFPAGSIDDFIVLRSDRTPVYNLAVVSDDAEAAVTHVIRGDDHISNTPKQIAIYRALGLDLPTFGHVPLILGSDGKRLSKRHGAMSVLAYREKGYLPRGMLNFLALLGWSPGDDREFFADASELTEAFRLDRVLKKGAVFDLEKLAWLNGRHIARSDVSDLARSVLDVLTEAAEAGGTDLAATHPTIQTDAERLASVIELVRERPRTVPALVDQVSPFFALEIEYEQAAVDRFWKRPDEAAGALRALESELPEVSVWEAGPLEAAIRGVADRLDVGAGKVINPLRLALMGQGVSPGIFEVVELMGRERVDRRIATALGYLDAKTAMA
ncbi:MAG: glutamate--tRNA ligase [Gemmatimonadetes bacterium]|nr:glutamate--tRNA ligase [Gemmatimonadota bacterium]